MRTITTEKAMCLHKSASSARFLLLVLTAMTSATAAETTPPKIATTTSRTEAARWGYVVALASPGSPEVIIAPASDIGK